MLKKNHIKRHLRILSLFAGIFIIGNLLFANEWIITTDDEFNAGTIYNLDVNGIDANAKLQHGQANTWWSPATTPPWWDSGYRYRRQICISNESSSVTIPDYYTVKADLPLDELIDSGKMRADLKDLRTVKYDWDSGLWIELERVVNPGGCIDFDGTDDQVTFSDSATLSPLSDLTLEAWINPTTTSGYNGVINKDNGSEPNRGFLLSVNNGNVLFLVSQDGSEANLAYVTSTETVSSNTWTHIAGVFEASTGNMDIFINGAKATVTKTGNVTSVYDSALTTRVGANASGGVPTGFFNGKIDNVRISDTTRYNADFTVTPEPFTTDANTLALWHFDEYYGTIAYDHSGNDNRGILQGETIFTAGKVQARGGARTDIFFKMPILSAVAAQRNNASFYIYYGNSTANTPAADKNQAFYAYADGFEYSDDITTRGWIISSGTGTSTTTTEKQQSDDRSLKMDSTTGDFSRVVYRAMLIPQNFQMTAWFYDDPSDIAKKDWITPSAVAAQKYEIGVNTENSAAFYSYYTGSAWATSAVLRSNGWHKIEWKRYSSTIYYYIDGILIYTRASSNDVFDRVYITSGSTVDYSGTAYWDEIYCNIYLPEDYFQVVPGSELDLDNLPTWGYRRQITITNNSTNVLPKGYTMDLTFDHASYVTAQKSLADGNDVRVVYLDQYSNEFIELHRMTANAWNSTTTKILFKTKSSIGGQTADGNYYLYYNPSANTPPAERNYIYVFASDFENDTAGVFPSIWKDMSSTGSYPTVSGTNVHSGLKSLRLQSTNTGTSAGVFVTMPISSGNYQFEFWAKADAINEDFEAGLKQTSTINGTAAMNLAVGSSQFQYRNFSGLSGLGGTPAADTWYKFVIYKTAVNTYSVYVYDAISTELVSQTAINSTATASFIVLENYSGSTTNYYSYFDDAALQYYELTTPTTALDTLESQGYPSTGTFLSDVFDTGALVTLAKNFNWTSSGSGLTIRIKANDSLAFILGDPDNGWSTINAAGDISSLNIKGRYMQIRAEFSGNDTSPEPILNDTTVLYNRAPYGQSNISPSNEAVMNTVTPTLTVSDFYDPNIGDTHAATRWQVRPASGSFGTGGGGWESDDDAVNLYSVTIPDNILSNWGTYFWRVSFKDSHGDWGDYSTETSFSIILGYDTSGDDIIAPPAPILYSPADTSQLSSSPTPTLDWSNVSDLSGVSYEVVVSTEDNFTSTPISQKIVTESQTTITALENGTYYWRVRAIDGADNTSPWSSETWSFVINIEPPDDTTPPPDDQNTGNPNASTLPKTSSKGCFIKALK
ncbi:MAG: hypothetical protein HZA48_05565 [Planctomycetes bacterium]|nr:hypothetical protein [Planctomycetota bacterium]